MKLSSITIKRKSTPITTKSRTELVVMPAELRVLIDRDTGKFIESVLIYFIKRPAKCEKTNHARCADLKDWFTYLHEFRFEWLEVGETQLREYIHIMQQTFSLNNMPFSNSTIRRRVSTIIGFYKYWSEQHKFKNQIVSLVPRKKIFGSNALIHMVENHVMIPDLMNIIPERPVGINYMTPEVWQKIKENISHSIPRLFWEVALQTGMRVSEVIALKCSDIRNIKSSKNKEEDEGYIRIIGKGRRPRAVYFPGWLTKELINYIDGKRMKIRARIKNSSYGDELFVNFNIGAHFGRGFSGRTAQRYFEAAVKKSRYVELITCTNVETGQKYQSEKALYTGHTTRHTFATWLYFARKMLGDHSPWLLIKTRLGHAYVKTTIDTYLRSVMEFESEISDKQYAHYQIMKHRNGGLYE